MYSSHPLKCWNEKTWPGKRSFRNKPDGENTLTAKVWLRCVFMVNKIPSSTKSVTEMEGFGSFNTRQLCLYWLIFSSPPIQFPPFTYQRLAFVFIFEIVKLITLENKPACVPGLDKASLLSQPPTLDSTVPPMARQRSLCRAIVFFHTGTRQLSCWENKRKR